MKKKTRTRNLKKISIICIIAILLSFATQFVNCWNFTGLTENIETGERRVANMDISLASYVWSPMSEKSVQFTKYVADPSLRYTEKFTSERLREKKLNEITDTLVAAEVIDPVEEESDNTPSGRKQEEVNDAFSTYYGVLIEITDYKTNIFDKKFNNTYMSTLGPNHKRVDSYNKYVEGIAEEDPTLYNKYINKVALLPVILFVGAIAGILLIFFFTINKKKLTLAPGIFALVIGLLNIVNLLTLPLFLLVPVKTLTIFGVIYAITTLVGLITLLGDIKEKKAAKAQ